MTDGQRPPAALPSRRHRLLCAAAAAAVGLASAVAALGAGELVAYVTGAPTAPVIAVGSAAIDLTPTPLKEYAVRTFGTHDKAVLLGGIYLTMTLLAALAGLLAVRRPAAGAAVFGAFGALGAWAALSRPGAATADCAPSIVAGLVGATAVLLLARLYRRALPTAATPLPGTAEAGETVERPEGAEAEVPAPPVGLTSRRIVLAATAGTFTAGALAGFGGRALTDRRFDVTAARAAVRLPAPAEPLPPLPAAVRPNVAGLSPFTTPNGDFYRVDTALTIPKIDPRDWALRIHGLVDRPQLLTFDDLLREPLEELDHTLSC
ncbi:molybdopterin-dependent oxidoreductase, partial [Kitasatospora saccharophila]|uniref:molybdopterin-dependent oxidoreductase n=1 Tax=Kitasatospora saccharophila TaxID=407973 RepID=UPI0031D2D7A0